METKYYRTVSVKESPKEKGWYSLTTNAKPEASGRAWFDGKEFKLNNKCYDYSGLLANGFELYWLEPLPQSDLDRDKMIELVQQTINDSPGYTTNPNLPEYIVDALLPLLSRPKEVMSKEQFYERYYKDKYSSGLDSMYEGYLIRAKD